MKKSLIFLLLYLRAAILARLRPSITPDGIRGSAVLMFTDPDYPGKSHGVVAFLLPPHTHIEDYSDDLFGPFGYSSQTTWRGISLYARDTWGFVLGRQALRNPALWDLRISKPGRPILLAGVRPFRGRHIGALNDPKHFILVKKKS